MPAHCAGMLLSTLFCADFGWGTTEFPAEYCGELTDVGNSDLCGDLGDPQGGCLQKLFRPFQT